MRVSNGAVPVTAGVGTNNTASTLARLERAKALGADAGLLVFPYYNKPNPHGLEAHVRASLDVGLPLVIYHVPGRTGQRLPFAQLAHLANLEGVVAVKEATGDVHYGINLMSQTDTPVLSGDDFTFWPCNVWVGAVSSASYPMLHPAKRLLCMRPQKTVISPLRQHLNRLWDLITFLFSDTNPVPCKAAMHQLGLCEPAVRLPLGPYSGPEPTDLLSKLGMF